MALRRDLAKARDDLGAFAKLAGTPLAKFQLAALGLQSRTSYILGPRQSGKSRSVGVLAAWWAFRHPDQHILIVSAGEMGSKRLLATVADLVVSSPLLSASVVDEQASLIKLSNGSTIRSLPASSKAIRGWSVDLLVIDEAVEIDDSIIDAALPTASARPEAKIVFLSTGGAPVGRSYEIYMAGLGASSTVVRSYRWRLKDRGTSTKANRTRRQTPGAAKCRYWRSCAIPRSNGNWRPIATVTTLYSVEPSPIRSRLLRQTSGRSGCGRQLVCGRSPFTNAATRSRRC